MISLSWPDAFLVPLLLLMFVLQVGVPVAVLWLGISIHRTVRRIEAQLAADRIRGGLASEGEAEAASKPRQR